MAPLNRDVLDKVLLDIEYMPAELEDLKVTLRLLDSRYEEMQDNYERYGEISNEEWKYRAEQISWHHELWRWDQPFDEVLRNKVLDYLFDDPHYQNQIYRYWGLMTHSIIEDQLRIRNTAVFYIESISEYLNPSEDHRYQLPEPFRFDLKEIVGTYRNYKKFLGEGQQNLEYGPYILFEADGRLFSHTLYNEQQDKNYQSDQTEEWVVLDPNTVISPSGEFMHLVKTESGQTNLEYAACNHRNSYLTKMD